MAIDREDLPSQHDTSVESAPGASVGPVATDGGASRVGSAMLQRKIQRRLLQRRESAAASGPASSEAIHQSAGQGVEGAGGALPHADRIQAAFGHHDVSGVQAHVGGAARSASESMGAEAYAVGNHVAFAGTPDLHTAAHEAAHVVQQRGGVQLKGGVGEAGDTYEAHADAVADAVVAGKSAEGLLDAHAPAGAAAPAAGPVQYYKQRKDGSKVSEDDKAILQGRQELYAHDDLRKEANEKLKTVGKNGSFVTLNKSPKQQIYKGKMLNVILPRWVPHGTKAGEHAGAEAANKPGGKDSEGIKSGGKGFKQWTDCGRSSAAVTGSQNNGDRSVVYNDGGKQKTSHGKANDGSVDGWLDTVPGGMANEIYFNLMPKFIQEPANAAFLVKGVHYDGDIAAKHWKVPATILEAKTQYAKLAGAGRDKFDKEAGINNYTNPEIGESYTMATEGQMPGYKDDSGSAWNYHWAGVIMKGGSDNVTLENYAVTEETAKKQHVNQYDYIDRDWNFEMYGTVDKDQTFHHDHLQSGTHGSEATSMRVRSDK